MARASIPVDLFNPGQVLASLGFLEAADALLGCRDYGGNRTRTRATRRVLEQESPLLCLGTISATFTCSLCPFWGRSQDPTPPLRIRTRPVREEQSHNIRTRGNRPMTATQSDDLDNKQPNPPSEATKNLLDTWLDPKGPVALHLRQKLRPWNPSTESSFRRRTRTLATILTLSRTEHA